MTGPSCLLLVAVLATAAPLIAGSPDQAPSHPAPPAPAPLPNLLFRQPIPEPPPPPGKADFSANVDLVLLDVAVHDSKGRSVGGLDRQDFAIFENGHPQPIQTFAAADAPVTVGLIVDSSRSMRPKRAEVVLAAEAFAEISNPRDEIFVVNFDDKISFGLPVGRPFENRIPGLRDALMNSPLDGRTALYDGILAGLDHATEGKNPKKVLLLVTDGGDNVSTHSFDDVLATARQSNATIYIIGLFDAADKDQNPGMLRRLAKATGGGFYQPVSRDDIIRLAKQIARDIRARYTLGYVPALGGAARYRTLRVAANAPGRGRLYVKTREGYLAPAEAPEKADAVSCQECGAK